MEDSFFDFVRYDIADNDLHEVAKFEGNENCDLLLFVRKSSFTENDRAFLDKIIIAVKRNLEDSLLCILEDGAKIHTSQISDFSKYKYIIGIGVAANDLCIHAKFHFFVPGRIGDQKFLFIPPLAEVSGDQEKKKVLWGALKEIFVVGST